MNLYINICLKCILYIVAFIAVLIISNITCKQSCLYIYFMKITVTFFPSFSMQIHGLIFDRRN